MLYALKIQDTQDTFAKIIRYNFKFYAEYIAVHVLLIQDTSGIFIPVLFELQSFTDFGKIAVGVFQDAVGNLR